MRRLIGQFLRNESGATAVEYGLLCGLLCLAIVGSIGLMANVDNGLLGRTVAKLSAAMGN